MCAGGGLKKRERSGRELVFLDERDLIFTEMRGLWVSWFDLCDERVSTWVKGVSILWKKVG